MKKYLILLSVVLILGGCAKTEQPVPQRPEPYPDSEHLTLPPEPNPPEYVNRERPMGDLEDATEVVEDTESSRTRWIAPREYKDDQETWELSDQIYSIKGCIEWKKVDPNADC
jgi:hypothetical protein